MSNWIIFPGETIDPNDRFLRAEFQVVNLVLNESPLEASIDWDERMDIMVAKILLSDPMASPEIKLEALLREIKARMALLLQYYCE